MYGDKLQKLPIPEVGVQIIYEFIGIQTCG